MARRGQPSQLNALIAIDKPEGCTSHDVVARVRRACDERRVGHAGTLDPLASGVMVVGIGQATRLLGALTLDTKGYVARIRFGSETDTDDAEGRRTAAAPCADELWDKSFAHGVLERFLGSSMQVPPAYSAISVNGVRSYNRARAGEDVDLPARPIEVGLAALLSIESEELHDEEAGPRRAVPVWTVAFSVSKGTYIRSLARDIGRAAGSAAHVSALRRTSSGCVDLGRSVSLEGLDADVARAHALDPVAALGLTAREVGERELADISFGRSLRCDVSLTDLDAATPASIALVHGGKLHAIARPDAGLLVMEQVYPQPIEGVRL